MKKSATVLLLTLLCGTAYAQENQLHLVYASPEGMRPASVGLIDADGTQVGLRDANGDGVSDLIMTTTDARGNLQDLLVVRSDITPTQEYWRVDNVPATLGLGEDVQFIGFTDALGGPVRHGVFVGTLSYLVDPTDNTLSWVDDTADGPVSLAGVLDLTKDGFDDLVFFLPDTKQVLVYSIDH